jgi:hypothetical protein
MTPSNAAPEPLRNDRSVFLILIALYVVILFPILRANRYYNDDLKRALIGRTGWDSTGRPLTTLLMKLLQCYDHALVDISPLTQFGAIAILAWLGVLVGRRYFVGSPGMVALAAFPLGAQPFFLENLSYKFDALSMSLAMLLALTPIVALKNDRLGWWLGILSLFVCLNFYQPAINAYLVFVLLDIVLAQLRGDAPREVMRQAGSRALQVGVAMLVYQLVVGIHVNGWVKQNSETIHTLHEAPLIAANFIDFYKYIGTSFNTQWWLYFGPVLLLMALVSIVIGVRFALKARRAHRSGIAALIFATSLLMPLAALALALGPMLLLVKPLVIPRVLLGVGALLAAALVMMDVAFRTWGWSDKWALSVGCMLALGMCSFASAYGNALGEQKNYEERIAARLADDLAEVRAKGVQSFLLDGAAGYSPVTAHVAEQFPLVRSLVPPYISADDMFRTHIFLLFFVPDMDDMRLRSDPETMKVKSAILAKACNVPALHETSAYGFRLVDGVAVVTFNGAQPNGCRKENASVE